MMWIKSKLNQKGAFAILATILVITILTLVAGYSDMLTKRYFINEVQGIMDTSSINTLKVTLDYDLIRQEIVGLDRRDYANTTNQQLVLTDYSRKVGEQYRRELGNQIATNGGIHEFVVNQVRVYFTYDNFGVGESTQIRPQITLESLVYLKVRTYELLDVANGLNTIAYSSRSSSNFQVTYMGETEDGFSELAVRTATRMVYR